jgi:oligopeptide/dipeptide ABC transporter ATP-binding protein
MSEVGTAVDPRAREPEGSALLDARHLSKVFSIHGSRKGLRAVDDVSISIDRGTTLGLVGESGSGKSTLARLATRLVDPTTGTVTLDGIDLTQLKHRELRRVRRRMQFVFQDPYSSMDPRSTVLDSVGEPLRTHDRLKGSQLRDRVVELAARVGITRPQLDLYPRELSGGQLQRLCIARAISVHPQLLVCDEAVSSLDVSTRAQVINLLRRLQDEFEMTYLFIAHDLAVVRTMSTSIAVMYVGRLIETGPADVVYSEPKHPYTESLLSAVPVPDPNARAYRDRIILSGDAPNPLNPPSGCRFHTRCPYVMDLCREVDPPAYEAGDGTTVHCHLHTAGPQLHGESVLHLRAKTVNGSLVRGARAGPSQG